MWKYDVICCLVEYIALMLYPFAVSAKAIICATH